MLTPKIALSKLVALRERERLFQVVWGAARWIALALTVVVVACWIDWLVDRSRETPRWLRVGLAGVELAAFILAGWFWLIRPWSRGPGLIPLARRVEQKFPEFDHRLITAIQLTRPDAQTKGMSPQLIENLTVEAEKIAERHQFSQLADYSRLKWSGVLALWPIGVLAFAALFFGVSLLGVLLQRQLLSDVEIPRKHQLENRTDRVFPAGDVVVVHYDVIGPIDEKNDTNFGYVRVYPEGKSSEDYPVEFEMRIDENRTRFKAHVLQSSINFEHRAWIADGRTKNASEVVFEPRPEVSIGEATVEMPRFVELKPDGKTRYSTIYPYGDVRGYEGSTAHVRILVQKPISDAKLLIYRRDANGRETIGDRLPMPGPYEEVEIDGAKKYVATASFDLVPGMIAYKAEVHDRNDFANDLAKTARRTIDVQPDQPPVVALLPERFVLPGVLASDEDILSGMPIPLGSTIPIEYTCRSPIGLGKEHKTKKGELLPPAYIVYRVNDGPWSRLPCVEVPETERSGPYDPLQAGFRNEEYQKKVLNNQVMFHAKPALDPSKDVPRQYGGGRYDLKTDSLRKTVMVDGKEKETELETGDRVEFYVEVFDAKEQMGRTIDARSVEVRPLSDVIDIAFKTIKSEEKLRELTKLQQGTFAAEKRK